MHIHIAVLTETQPPERRVVKRGEGKGYAGIVNSLFYAENCQMVYGDAQAVLIQMITAVRPLVSGTATQKPVHS